MYIYTDTYIRTSVCMYIPMHVRMYVRMYHVHTIPVLVMEERCNFASCADKDVLGSTGLR